MSSGRRSQIHSYLGGVSTESILESISDGVFSVDSQWRVTSFNRAAEQITGVSRHAAHGQRCCDVFHSSMCESECALRHTLATGEPIINRAAFIVDRHGRRIPISVSTAILRNSEGEVVGGAETFRDLSLIEQMKMEIRGRYQVGEIVSSSEPMRRVLQLLPRIAESDSTVLIQGETGTGKELVARAIHALSNRSGPFVAVNCGALPDSLLESELFGYKAGAFTGASRDKAGRFALADGGTLFLDEIGEVSAALQTRLLRVLQERVFEPLGATRAVATSARVIAATNKDLQSLVSEGSFRQDLFYRIHVMKVELPPLRQRREDIPLLVEQLVGKLCATQGKQVPKIGSDVMAVLMAHAFPGNVRELQNTLEHACVLCEGGAIELKHLPRDLVPAHALAPTHASIVDAVHATESHAIRQALAHNHFNRLATARQLGMHKSTLFRKIRQFGIDLPETDGRCRKG